MEISLLGKASRLPFQGAGFEPHWEWALVDFLGYIRNQSKELLPFLYPPLWSRTALTECSDPFLTEVSQQVIASMSFNLVSKRSIHHINNLNCRVISPIYAQQTIKTLSSQTGVLTNSHT